MLGRARNASKHKPKYYQRKDLVVVAFLEFGIKRKEKFYIYSSGAKKKKKRQNSLAYVYCVWVSHQFRVLLLTYLWASTKLNLYHLWSRYSSYNRFWIWNFFNRYNWNFNPEKKMYWFSHWLYRIEISFYD